MCLFRSRAAAKNVVVAAKVVSSARPRARCVEVKSPVNLRMLGTSEEAGHTRRPERITKLARSPKEFPVGFLPVLAGDVASSNKNASTSTLTSFPPTLSSANGANSDHSSPRTRALGPHVWNGAAARLRGDALVLAACAAVWLRQQQQQQQQRNRWRRRSATSDVVQRRRRRRLLCHARRTQGREQVGHQEGILPEGEAVSSRHERGRPGGGQKVCRAVRGIRGPLRRQ